MRTDFNINVQCKPSSFTLCEKSSHTSPFEEKIVLESRRQVSEALRTRKEIFTLLMIRVTSLYDSPVFSAILEARVLW